jgi:preprotein translocase subunit SecE
VARDRKRAKQRRQRQSRAAAGRGSAAPAPPALDERADGSAVLPTPPQPVREDGSAVLPTPTQPIRADLPGALEHAGDVDEFDAALVKGAGGVPAPDTLSEDEIEAEALSEGDLTEDELQEPSGPSGPGRSGPSGPGGAAGGPGGGGGGAGGVSPEQASGAPLRGGGRAIGFLRASWAELQRVQWPDRRQVTQATAVVLGFVAIAGAYLGLADFVAKEIVEVVLG